MTVRRNYLLSLVNQGAQVGVLSLIMIVVARTLGPAGQGTVTLVLAAAAMATTVTHLSQHAGIAYLAGSGRTRLGVLAANALLYAVIVGGAVALGVWWLRDWLGATLRLSFDAPLWRATAALLAVTYFIEFGTALHTGARQFGRLAAVNCVSGVLGLVAFVVLLPRFGTPVAACLLFVAYRGGRALGLWAAVPWRSAGPVRPEWGAFRFTAGFSLQGHVGTILQIGVYRLDLFIVNGLAGETATGLYAAAVFFAEIVVHAPRALGAVVLPETAARSAAEQRVLAARLCRQVFWCGAGGAASIALVAPVAVPFVFGAAFEPAVAAVWLLAPGIVGLAVTHVLVPALVGSGRPWVGSGAAALALALTVGLDLVMIPRWGLYGAAAASSVAYVAQAVFVVAVFRRLMGTPIADMLAFRREDYRGVTALLTRLTGNS